METREFIRDIPDTFVDRECFRLPEAVKKVIVLYGVRRSGKTYLLYHIMKQNIDLSLYIDFEDERLKGFTTDDFETLREAFYELFPALINQKAYFLFDEIQIVDGWEKFCRRLVEKSQAEVIVAGSSSQIYPENISTSLRGRAWSIEVFPFSFKEFVTFEGIIPDNHLLFSENRFRMVDLIDRYVKWGGFPEVTAVRSDFEKKKILDEYLEAIFFKDLVERYKISNITLINALRNKIYSTFSTRFSLNAFYNKMKGSFPFSKDLLFKYYQHLLDSKTVFEARMFSDSEYKKTRNPSKVYIIDSGLSHKVAHDDSARILENIVFIEMLRRGLKPYYFFQANECDFIVKTEERTDVFQVTYKMEAGNREREINGLIDAAKHVNASKGYILTHNESDEFTVEGIEIEVVPTWKWLLGLNE